MALNELVGCITRPAAADLSAGIYRFVELNSSGDVSICNGAGELSIGVLQNKPNAAGRAAQVCVQGVTKLIAGGTVAANGKVTTDAAGAAVAAASTNHVLGVCVKGGVVGDVIEVLLGAPCILV